MAPIFLDHSLQQGIFRDLNETWRNKFPIYERINNLYCYTLPKTNVRFADYGWKESVPFPEPWIYERGRTHKSFLDRKITVAYYPYELAIDINEYDVRDDQLGDSRVHIEKSVERFLQIPSKLVAEYLNGAAALNPALENAYDGAGLYSAVDGDGANRLQAAGGNIITSSGLGVDGIANDLYRAQQRFYDFLDTAGELLYDESDLTYDKFHIIAPQSLNDVMYKVAEVEYLRTDLGSNTSESNYFKGKLGGIHIFPRLTDNSDWFIVLDHGYYKPFALRQEDDLRSIWSDMTNSDRAREFNTNTLFADLRTGLGPWFPGATIKVDT